MSTGSCIATPRQIKYSPEVENAIQQLMPNISRLIGPNLNPRWVALRLLDGDQTFIKSITNYLDLNLHLTGLQEVAV